MIYVSFLGTTGSGPHIDTGLKWGDFDTIDITIEFTSTPTTHASPIGLQGNIGSGGDSFIFDYQSNRFAFRPGSEDREINMLSDLALNHTYHFIASVIANTASFTVDDVLQGTSTSNSISTSLNCWLFNFNPGYSNRYAPCKIYNCQLLKDGVVVRDFHPALSDTDVPGMYDAITDTFFTNSGSGSFIYGDPIQDIYTIAFNANGGEGNMPPQIAPFDEDVTLNACTYTFTDATFVGWGTSAGGPAIYADGATVRNLAAEGETITLYAIWDRELYIDLQHNASENIKLDKTLTTILHCAGKLREECTITAPDILVDAPLDVVLRCNYCTIPLFGRSFFINNVTADTNNLIRISCTVDAISSFKDEIRANKGIVRRSEIVYNLNINDGSLVAYQNPYVLTEPFPSGFTGASFVLATAGA